METIGVGLIGTGYMGKCHALAWNAVRPVFGDCAKARLVHLAEIEPGLAARRASEFGFERSTGDWRDLLADPEVEVVSVTAPNAFHAEMAVAALEAGKHVWCEKPMATSLDDAARMLAAARASGKIAVLGYNYIQNPAIRHIKTLLEGGPSAPSITCASRWTKTSWPIRRRHSTGRAKRPPAMARLTILPCIRCR